VFACRRSKQNKIFSCAKAQTAVRINGIAQRNENYLSRVIETYGVFVHRINGIAWYIENYQPCVIETYGEFVHINRSRCTNGFALAH
jgi:roadblock/LC7 domain-containing protein